MGCWPYVSESFALWAISPLSLASATPWPTGRPRKLRMEGTKICHSSHTSHPLSTELHLIYTAVLHYLTTPSTPSLPSVKHLVSSPEFLSAKWTNKLQDVVANLTIPDAFQDFYKKAQNEEEKSNEEYKRKWTYVCKEVFSLLSLQLLSNLLLTLPLLITGNLLYHLLMFMSTCSLQCSRAPPCHQACDGDI